MRRTSASVATILLTALLLVAVGPATADTEQYGKVDGTLRLLMAIYRDPAAARLLPILQPWILRGCRSA